jgi:cation transport ATPase
MTSTYAIPRSMAHQTSVYSKQKRSDGWWDRLKTGLRKTIHGQQSAQNPSTTTAHTHLPQPREQEIKHSLLVSSTSLGFAVAGLLLAPPLQIACIPVLVYLGMQPAQRACQALREEEHIGIDMAETAVVAFSIIQGSYFVSSLAFSVYYLGRWVEEHQRQETHPQAVGRSQTWARVLVSEQEVVMQVDDLSTGDTIVVQTGEMIPIAGVVTDGVAWIKCYNQPHSSVLHQKDGQPCQATVAVGHQVDANSVVQIGRLHISVESSRS